MKKCNGSITIFLSLIMMVFFTLICVILESARVSSAAARAESITHTAIDSCFAMYGREVFEDYGVMLLFAEDDELKNNIVNIGELNCDTSNNRVYGGMNMFRMNIRETDLSNIVHIVDKDGEIFANQVCDYMKYRIPKDVLDKLIKKSEDTIQGEAAGEECEKINECNKLMEKVEKDLIEMKKNCGYLLNIKETLGEHINNMKISGAASYGKYVSWHDDVKEYLGQIVYYGEQFSKDCDIARSNISVRITQLGKEKDKYSSDVYDTMMNELNTMKNNVSIENGDMYGAVECCNKGKNLLTILSSVQAGVEKYKDSQFKEVKYLEEIEKYIPQFITDGMDISIGSLGDGDGENVYEKQVKSLMEAGVLALVVNGKEGVSDKSVSQAVTLPSFGQYNKSAKWNSWKGVSEAGNKVLMSEYAIQHFGSYINKKEGPIDYQIEYIISGKLNDKENLADVAERIIMFRTGFNFISLLKDGEKRDEAYAAALAIAGATGIPAIVRVVQFGIMFAWSSAESVVDTRNILAGKKVALVKSKDEWNLSLTSLANINGAQKESDDKNGLAYEDYLWAMLYGMNKVDASYRIMDLIQMNVCRKYNRDFLMSKCIVSADVKCTYDIDSVFAGIIIGNGIPNGKTHSVTVKESYGY